MHFFVFLILTAFAVSIDSMVVGFSIGLKTKKTWFFSFVASFATLLLCLASNLIASLAKDGYDLVLKIIGSLFLIFAGIANFAKKQDTMPDKLCIKECFSLGFAVGIDAGIANLSVCLLGYTQLWIPFLFATTHFATISLGSKIANAKLTNKLKNTNKISGFLLVCLGLFKLFQ